jgi:hypothetical protein
VGIVKRRVLQGLWRRLVGVGIIGPGHPSGCPGPLPQIETFVTLCGMVGVRAKVLGRMG